MRIVCTRAKSDGTATREVCAVLSGLCAVLSLPPFLTSHLRCAVKQFEAIC